MKNEGNCYNWCCIFLNGCDLKLAASLTGLVSIVLMMIGVLFQIAKLLPETQFLR